MTMKKYILGPTDPEMELIERILLVLGVAFQYATVDGIRLNRTNAYAMDMVYGYNLIFVECNTREANNFPVCDHHNEDNEGYHLDHRDFLKASSVGQVLTNLFTEDFQATAEGLGYSVVSSVQEGYFFSDGQWFFGLNGFAATIDPSVVFVAASDHCSRDMYLGKCSGVDQSLILDRVMVEFSEKFDHAVSHILDSFKRYEAIVLGRFQGDIIDLTHLELGNGYSMDYLLVREVSLLHNIPIAVKTRTDDIVKVMMLSLTDFQVNSFLKDRTFNNASYKNVFGVPVRGYAGGELV